MQKHVESPRTMSSREFNQNVAKAKRAAAAGPVTITDRGRPAYVLMSHEDYFRLLQRRPSIVELLNHEESKDLEFEPARMRSGWLKPADFGD